MSISSRKGYYQYYLESLAPGQGTWDQVVVVGGGPWGHRGLCTWGQGQGQDHTAQGHARRALGSVGRGQAGEAWQSPHGGSPAQPVSVSPLAPLAPSAHSKVR